MNSQIQTNSKGNALIVINLLFIYLHGLFEQMSQFETLGLISFLFVFLLFLTVFLERAARHKRMMN